MHSSEETFPLTNSDYLYQLSFSFKPSEKMGLQINDDQLRKFDSSSAVKGFLKKPVLEDTIIVNIIGLNMIGGTIKYGINWTLKRTYRNAATNSNEKIRYGIDGNGYQRISY